jgi:hypothetical protein
MPYMHATFAEARKTPGKSNVGQKWTKEQEDELLNDLKTMNVSDIANKYERTIGGINSRLRLISAQMMHAGKSIEEVSEITKLMHSEIEIAFKKHSHKLKTEKHNNDSGKSTETQIEVLMDIRDILLRMNAKLEKLCNTLC